MQLTAGNRVLQSSWEEVAESLLSGVLVSGILTWITRCKIYTVFRISWKRVRIVRSFHVL